MKYNCVIYYYFIIMIFVACKDQRTTLIERDGETHRLTFYTNDSIKIDTQLKGEKKHGREQFYYNNGNLMAENNWYEGSLYGHQFEYYDIIDTVIILEDDEPYLAKRNRLRSYEFIEDKMSIFKISFTKKGEVENFEGNFVLFYVPDKEKYTVGDTMQMNIQFPAIDIFSIEAGLFEKLSTGTYRFIDSLNLHKSNMTVPGSYVFKDNSKVNLAIIYKVSLDDFVVRDTTFLPSITPIGVKI